MPDYRPAPDLEEIARKLVIVKEGTKEYHRPWCPVIRDGAGVLALSVGQAEAPGGPPTSDGRAGREGSRNYDRSNDRRKTHGE